MAPDVLTYSTEKVFGPSLLYFFMMCIPGIVLTGIAAWMGLDGGPPYWLLFLALGIAVLILPVSQLIPGQCWLRMGEAGFSVRRYFKTEDFRWNDIVRLDLVPVQYRSQLGGRSTTLEVAVTCRADPKNRDLSRQQRRAIARHTSLKPHCMIDPGLFGLECHTMLSMFEDYRQRSLKIDKPDSDRA